MSTGHSRRREELLHALKRTGRRLSNATVMFHQAVADRLGMSLTDYKVLGVLADAGPITAGRLAEVTGLTTGGVTGIVDRLERTGWVRRERDPGDRRRVIVEAVRTPEREEAFARIFTPLMRGVEEDVAGYGDEQLALVVDFMDRNARTLQRVTGEVRKADDPGT